MTGSSVSLPGLPPERYYEQIIGSLTSGVVACDARGRVITANPAARAVFEASTEELGRGAALDELPAAAPLVDVFEEVAESGEAVLRRELTVDLSEGRSLEIGLSASLLSGPADFNGVIFLFTDLTEWRRLEREAQLNSRLAALGELTAGVVHELRNPVSVISGWAELLARRLPEGDERRAQAEAIVAEAEALERTVSQFLSFARPFDLTRSWCDPSELTERAVAFCTRKALRKRADIRVDCPRDLPLVHVDNNLLTHALANVLANAVDAVDEGGQAGIEVREKDPGLEFSIWDNGPGIPTEPGVNIFEPFFTQKEGGTGLGLTITHRTVTAHGGRVSFAAREGGGTRFTIAIPVDPQKENGRNPRFRPQKNNTSSET